jgi:dUTP pyrophosphatase
MKIKIKRVDKQLPLPTYQTKGSAGCDLYARVTMTIEPKKLAKIPANVIVETPKGYMFLIASRGSTPFKKGLMMAHGVGIGDQDFWGPEDEYHIPVYNITDAAVTVERGERIAQGIFIPIEIAEWDEVEEINEPNRGMFGSTG